MAKVPQAKQFRKQHFFPPSYSQFFAEEAIGRKSRIWAFDGVINHPMTVEKIGREDCCYSSDPSDRERIETIFSEFVEKDYPPVVHKVLTGQRLHELDIVVMLKFGLFLKFRSPSYKVNCRGNRLDNLGGIISTGLRLAFPDVDIEEARSSNEFYLRLLQRFKLRIIALERTLVISDNPIFILKSQQVKQADAMIIPIAYDHLLVLYREDRVVARPSLNDRDYRNMFLHMRSARYQKFIYTRVPMKEYLGDQLMPASQNVQSVTDSAVSHDFPPLDEMFDFLRYRLGFS